MEGENLVGDGQFSDVNRKDEVGGDWVKGYWKRH